MRIDLGQAAKWQQQQMGNLGSKDKLLFFQVVVERERSKDRWKVVLEKLDAAATHLIELCSLPTKLEKVPFLVYIHYYNV